MTSQENDNQDEIKNLIDEMKEHYSNDENLKDNFSKRIQDIENMIEDKENLSKTIIKQAVESFEKEKKEFEIRQKEEENIKKKADYNDVMKKIDYLKKDKNLNEIWTLIYKKSPELAYNSFKNLTDNFIKSSIASGGYNETMNGASRFAGSNNNYMNQNNDSSKSYVSFNSSNNHDKWSNFFRK